MCASAPRSSGSAASRRPERDAGSARRDHQRGVRPGLGSAVFLHVARAGYPPTEGCVALALDDLLAVLAEAAPGDTLVVEPS